MREREKERRERERTNGKLSAAEGIDLFVRATVFVKKRKVCDEIQYSLLQ